MIVLRRVGDDDVDGDGLVERALAARGEVGGDVEDEPERAGRRGASNAGMRPSASVAALEMSIQSEP